jgi:hypothetical protein
VVWKQHAVWFVQPDSGKLFVVLCQGNKWFDVQRGSLTAVLPTGSWSTNQCIAYPDGY